MGRHLKKNKGGFPKNGDKQFSRQNFRPKKNSSKILKKNDNKTVTNILAIDCEYVGTGYEGHDDFLARVSIVNVEGECIYDKYVKPKEKVTDFRTEVSGVRPGHLINGDSYENVRQEVCKMIANKIIVGHALQNDFRVLGLTHPLRLIRDTSKFKPLRQMAECQETKTPSLKLLASKILGIQIQTGEHCSIVDAKTALRIYLMHSTKWESEIQKLKNRKIIK